MLAPMYSAAVPPGPTRRALPSRPAKLALRVLVAAAVGVVPFAVAIPPANAVIATAAGVNFPSVLASPTITTNASADVVSGAGTLSDSATVGGRVNPQAGATVDFRLYGPNDAACAGTPVFQSLGNTYSVAGGAVTSASFTPTQAGTYRWVASYSGDANNAAVAGACNDANESAEVNISAADDHRDREPGEPAGAGRDVLVLGRGDQSQSGADDADVVDR